MERFLPQCRRLASLLAFPHHIRRGKDSYLLDESARLLGARPHIFIKSPRPCLIPYLEIWNSTHDPWNIVIWPDVYIYIYMDDFAIDDFAIVLPWWDMVQQKLGAKPLLDVLRPQCSRRRRVWRWPWTKPWCAFWTFCVWPLGTMMPLAVIDICRWRGFNQWRCGFCQQNCRGMVNWSLCCKVYMAQKNGVVFPLEMVRFERPSTFQITGL